MYAGDIAAAVGLKDTTTGDTLCDEKNVVILESMEFPDPVISVSIEPKTKADQDKMGIALPKLAEEDPTFKTYTDQETGQTIIQGMGELHLEIIVDRLQREFKVECNVGTPAGCLQRDHYAARRSGRQVSFASRADAGSMVTSRSSSNRWNAVRDIVFENKIVGGAIPKEYIPAVDEGIHEAHAKWRHRWISDGRCKGHAVRRFLPRRRLFRNGL